MSTIRVVLILEGIAEFTLLTFKDASEFNGITAYQTLTRLTEALERDPEAFCAAQEWPLNCYLERQIQWHKCQFKSLPLKLSIRT